MPSFLKYLLVLPLLIAMVACDDHGEDAPHPALLYNICDVAEAEDGRTVFHLYRPDADDPIILTANGFSTANEEGQLASVGTSGMLAYYPADGRPYANSDVNVSYWASINNMRLLILKEESVEKFMDAWPESEPVEYLAGWRGGGKLYMRLRLPYSAQPRNFALLADPSTLQEEIPTVYLYNKRSTDSPTFDRQYYFAFDILSVWNEPNVRGLRVLVNDALSSQSPKELLFLKND